MEKTEPTVRLVFAPEDGPSLRELLLELLRAMREEPERMGARRGLSMRRNPPGNGPKFQIRLASWSQTR